MQTGRRLHGARVVMVLAPGDGATAAVASKRIGGSVERNRARRVLRAALREVVWTLEGYDVVAVARPAIRGATATELVGEMRELVRG